MQVKFNVTGKERKELVKGIERITAVNKSSTFRHHFSFSCHKNIHLD